jgi:hypothetical protein
MKRKSNLIGENANLALRIAINFVVVTLTGGCSLSFPDDEFLKTCEKYVSIEVYDTKEWHIFVAEMKRTKQITEARDKRLSPEPEYEIRSSIAGKSSRWLVPIKDKIIYPETRMIFDKRGKYIGLINDLYLAWPAFGYNPHQRCSEYHKIRNIMLTEASSEK